MFRRSYRTAARTLLHVAAHTRNATLREAKARKLLPGTETVPTLSSSYARIAVTWRSRTMPNICPECDNPLTVDVDEVDEGETVTCDECGTELEIISLEPLELIPVDAEGYDDEDLSREADDDEDA